MRSSFFVLIAAAFAFGLAAPAGAQTKSPPALTGKVSSAEEGAMEGVVVSAKKGIVTVSVVSDDKGAFSFPASKLDAGDYALSIRAAGYDLQGPTIGHARSRQAGADRRQARQDQESRGAAHQSRMDAQRARQRRPAPRADRLHQLPQRRAHPQLDLHGRPVRRRHEADGHILQQQLLQEAAGPPGRRATSNVFVPNADKVAAYFASINRSTGERNWDLKTMPRVSGAGTHVIITEYDLPDPTIQPHDVMVDADGIVWHSDFAARCSAASTPRRSRYKSFAVPMQREGWPTGALDLETDPHGDLWLGLMFQAGAAKFDKKTADVLDDPAAGRHAEGRYPAGHGRRAELDRRQQGVAAGPQRAAASIA